MLKLKVEMRAKMIVQIHSIHVGDIVKVESM